MKRESKVSIKKTAGGEEPKQHIDLSEMDESQIADKINQNAAQSQDQQVVRFSVKR